MTKHCRYELVKGSKKEICPQCGGGPHREKSFKRYIDTQTMELLPLPSGRCDRINNCTYNSNPYKNGEAERIYQEGKSQNTAIRPPSKKAVSRFTPFRVRKQETPQYDSIPNKYYLDSGTPERYDINTFITYLREYFGIERTNALIREYCIGNSSKDNSATIFWQISYSGEIRTGKKITYNTIPNSTMFLGKDIKRVKSIPPYLIHKNINPAFKVYPCFFGEHLLKRYPGKPVLIVEAEKSAIIASAFYPDFVCIAAGGSAGCRWASEYFAMKPLIGREVVMYPDLKNTEEWEKKAEFLRENRVNVFVSKKLLDIAAPEDFENDNDLADYLLRFSPPSKGVTHGVWSSIPVKAHPILSPSLVLELMITKNKSVKTLIDSVELVPQ